jgi:hypothetical protein
MINEIYYMKPLSGETKNRPVAGNTNETIRIHI